MFDFNCDVAQSYGVYRNDDELEIAKYASSVNVSAGLHSGDPVNIRKALLFVKENEIAVGAHIGFPDIQGFGKRKMDLEPEELEAIVIYQIGAIEAYAKTMDLAIEHVRCHGALKNMVNENTEVAEVVANAVKKVNPWLNLYVQDFETKKIIEKIGLKSAYEVDFNETTSIRQIREMINKPDTIHFRKLEDIKRAYDVIKPTPVNYNRVQEQI